MIPKITIATFAVYSVMGGIGYGLTHVRHTSHLGDALIVASFIGVGYALSHAIVENVAPSVINGVDAKEIG